MTRRAPRVIAFDATPLELSRPAGVSHYTLHLLAALLRSPTAPPIALVAARQLPPSVIAGTLGQVGPRFPNRTLWMQLVLPGILQRLQPRLAHFTNFTAPLVGRTPYVLTLHDMTLFRFRHTQGSRHVLAARGVVPLAARRAAIIVTVSESARRDVLDVLQLPAERVRVVYNAAGPEYRPIADGALLDRVRTKYRLPGSFILHVGTVEPRKNIQRLVDAFVELRQQGRAEELVLAGQLGWKYAALLSRIEKSPVASAIRVLGYVDRGDLPALYNLARVVALPSLYEGFGLPILEGMASGVPVLTSDRSAMKEVGSQAAVLVDPESTESIAGGLARLLDDEALRGRLRDAGLRRAAEFSWDTSARQMLEIYDEVAS